MAPRATAASSRRLHELISDSINSQSVPVVVIVGDFVEGKRGRNGRIGRRVDVISSIWGGGGRHTTSPKSRSARVKGRWIVWHDGRREIGGRPSGDHAKRATNYRHGCLAGADRRKAEATRALCLFRSPLGSARAFVPIIDRVYPASAKSATRLALRESNAQIGKIVNDLAIK